MRGRRAKSTDTRYTGCRRRVSSSSRVTSRSSCGFRRAWMTQSTGGIFLQSGFESAWHMSARGERWTQSRLTGEKNIRRAGQSLSIGTNVLELAGVARDSASSRVHMALTSSCRGWRAGCSLGSVESFIVLSMPGGADEKVKRCPHIQFI